MHHPDMVYNGTSLTWHGHCVFNATSGLPEHQNASQQAHADEAHNNSGPIPEGLYSFPLIFGTDATMIQPGQLDKQEGIEHLPGAWQYHGRTYQNQAWGPDRVRLTIVHIDDPKNRHRAGFYLHDSSKGSSHGCIEVAPFFLRQLRRFVDLPRSTRAGRTRLYLRVKYPSASASTYGRHARSMTFL